MKVHELIEKLKEFPQDRDVSILYDMEIRMGANIIYLSKGGDIVITDYNESVYSDDSRPVDAPTREEQQWYSTESDPEYAR